MYGRRWKPSKTQRQAYAEKMKEAGEIAKNPNHPSNYKNVSIIV